MDCSGLVFVFVGLELSVMDLASWNVFKWDRKVTVGLEWSGRDCISSCDDLEWAEVWDVAW